MLSSQLMNSETFKNDIGFLPYISNIKEIHEKLARGVSDGQKVIECRKCLMIPQPPVQACEKYHIRCKTCNKESPSVCSICGSLWDDTKSQAIEEKVIGKYFNCIYRNEGCQEEIFNKNFPLHVEKCIFKVELGCILCPGKLRLHNYFSHLESHNVRKIELNPQDKKFTFRVRCHLETKLKEDLEFERTTVSWYSLGSGVQFFHCHAVSKGFFHVWIYAFGLPEFAKKFLYCTKLFIEDDELKSSRFVVHELPVHSVFRTPREIMEEKTGCLVVPLSQIFNHGKSHWAWINEKGIEVLRLTLSSALHHLTSRKNNNHC